MFDIKSLFKLKEVKRKKNGVVVKKYIPTKDIFIKSINPDTHEIELKKVLEYSVHENIKMYKIYDELNRFEPFHASEDHSLLCLELHEDARRMLSYIKSKLSKYHVIVNNCKNKDNTIDTNDVILTNIKDSAAKNGKIVKISPIQLKKYLSELQEYMCEFKNNICYGDKHIYNIVKQYTFISKYYLIDKKGKLIPVDENIKIEFDETQTVGYDFTVEDNYNFLIDNGIFVQDTVAVYMPMTRESQQEIKKLMFNKTRSPATGDVWIEFKQDIILGWYNITKDKKKLSLSKAPKHLTVENLSEYLLQNPTMSSAAITYKSHKTNHKPIDTTLGRVLFNLCLPDKVPFINEPTSKKIFKQVAKYLSKFCTDEEIAESYKIIEQIGFKFATIDPTSMPLEELILPAEFKKKIDKIKTMDVVKGKKYLNELEKELIKYVKKNYPQIADIFDSGARGSWSDLTQLVLAKGYVSDAEGKIIKIPVAKGFVYNLDAEEYFRISPSGRYGIMSRSINTDKPGYLTRRLIFASSHVYLSDKNKCNTNHFLEYHIDDEQEAALFIDRYLDDGTKITDENYKEFVGQTIKLRSPIYCASENGICKTCYGDLYKVAESDAIGKIAAQSIGERGTQLIMRVFHTGGVAEVSEFPHLVEGSESLIQDGTQIIAKTAGKVIIEKDACDFTLFEDRLLFKAGLLLFEFDDGTTFDTTITPEDGLSIEIYYDSIKSDDNVLKLSFSKGEIIAQIELQTQDLLLAVNRVERMFEARGEYANLPPSKLLKRILEIYKVYGVRSVHFEVVLSEMYRDFENPYQPLRFANNKERYLLLGVSTVPFYTSPILALGFQNV